MSAARIAPVLKSRLATSATTFQAVRSISSTASLSKGPVETAKDTLKKADQAVSSAAVKGIDKGEQAREKAKEAMHMSSGEAKSKVKSMQGEAAQAAGQTQAQAEQAAGKAKGKAHEAMGEVKGKAKEAKHETVG